MDGAELSARSVGSAEGIPAGLLITTNSTVSALRRNERTFLAVTSGAALRGNLEESRGTRTALRRGGSGGQGSSANGEALPLALGSMNASAETHTTLGTSAGSGDS